MKYLYILILLTGCQEVAINNDKIIVASATNSQYALDKPDKVYEMPSQLNEISGICFLNEKEILCHEDENGKIYTYNIADNKVTSTTDFGPAGDYEDIDRFKDKTYIVRSDGVLFSVSGKETAELKTSIPEGENIEGLCADAANNRLLLASKKKGKIYAYEPGAGQAKELWMIDEKKFAPSALAIHPVTKEIYVISSAGKQLIILSADGKIKGSHQLISKYFIQPEGMAFAANGDLYISNEGRSGKGNILLFRYR